MYNKLLKIKDHSWLKQLFISILGTSIGVGLTFTADRCVDSHKQQEAQRETAIMAVCDIDEIVQGLKEEMHLEDSLFKVTMYVSTHQDQIDSMSMDTLLMAFEYLYDDPMLVKGWTADTKENSFNSGMDARMNLGNSQFYDNVQSCYYIRRSLIKKMTDAPLFQRPVRKEDYEGFLQSLGSADIDYLGVPSPGARRWVMKQIFAQGATALYIKRFFSRRDAYRYAVTDLERLNRENKLLMNISDEDIETYIKRYSDDVTEQASADRIIGTWEAKYDNSEQTYVFREDNTTEMFSHFTGQLQAILNQEHMEVLILTPTTIHMKGRWELKGDTLMTDYDVNSLEIVSFELDVSQFPQSALERLKDSLEIKKEMTKNYMLEGLRRQPFKEERTMKFDRSGNTMVWTKEVITPAGAKETTSFQVYRKPE